MCIRDRHWLDPIVGMLSGAYLLTAVYSLCKTSLSSLLDMSDRRKSAQITRYLNEFDINVTTDDVCFLFTGTKNKICVSIKISTEKDFVSKAKIVRQLLQKHTKNCVVDITTK